MKVVIALSLVVAVATAVGMPSWRKASAKRGAARPAPMIRLLRTSPLPPDVDPPSPSSDANEAAPTEEPKPTVAPLDKPAPKHDDPQPAPSESIDELWEKAIALEANGDWRGAIAAYDAVIGRSAESVEMGARACYRMALCIERLGYPNAMRAAKQVLLQLVWNLAEEPSPELKEVYDLARAALGADYTAPPEVDRNVREKMKNTKISLRFEEANLPTMVTFVREYTRLNIIVDEDKVNESTLGRRVTLSFDDRPFMEAFESMCSTEGLGWFIDNGTIILTTKPMASLHSVAVGVPDFEQDNPLQVAEDELIQRCMDSVSVSLDFTDAALEDVLNEIRLETRVQMVIDPEVPEGRAARKITFQLKDLQAGPALALLLAQFGLDWYADQGVLHVTTSKEAYARKHILPK